MTNREKIYDEQISPLMVQIIKVCKEHDIPIFAHFEYAPGDFCTTHIATKQNKAHGVFAHFKVLLQCVEKEGVNVDKYLIWMMHEAAKYGSHTSVFLSQLGVDPRTGKNRFSTDEKEETTTSPVGSKSES